jgi:CubicO group peptidase (beta-lactamase class C family)
MEESMPLLRTLLTAVLGFALFCTHPAIAGTARQMLGVDELRATIVPAGLVDNRWFTPAEGAAAAKHNFTGTLVLQELEMGTDPAKFSSREVRGKDPKIFPAVRIAFFTDAGNLVPVSQDVIRYGSTKEGRSYWDVIVQPGRVWSESGDGGWSRASFPFALVHLIDGETHIGLASFLYNGTEVSNVRFQIVQQTAPSFVVDYFTAWGQVSAFYEPGNIDNLDTLKAAYAVERTNLFPIKIWDELAAEVGADKLRNFESLMDQDEVLVSGLVFKGTLYLKPCKSAAGPMPYCDRMRFGVWSVTKSAAGAVALLRLAQKYGPEVFDAKIKDYVTITASHQGWDDVTFGDALDMATGVGFGTARRDPNIILDGYYEGYEGYYDAWFMAPSEEAKLTEGFKSPDLPWGPGEVARYRDQDIFLLGVAMDRLLKSKEGAAADIWSMLVNEVYRPIGVAHAPTNRTIEADGRQGQPMMAFGLYATLGDLARIAQLYHARGQHNGVQILHAGKIDELLYGPRERGLSTGFQSQFGRTRYFRSFWNIFFLSHEGCPLYIPEMQGWGGNIVSLMPDNLTGIRLAKNWVLNNGVFNTAGMMAVGDRLGRFCQ